MDDNELCKYDDWFTATVIEVDDEPAGFRDWTEGITQYKYTIILPDEQTVSAKIFMDHQKIFDDGAYTHYLINRYNEATSI